MSGWFGKKNPQSFCSECNYKSEKTATLNLSIKKHCKTEGCRGHGGFCKGLFWKDISEFGYEGNESSKQVVSKTPSEKAYNTITTKLSELAGELTSINSAIDHKTRLKAKKAEAIEIVRNNCGALIDDVQQLVQLCHELHAKTRKDISEWSFLRIERNNLTGKLLQAVVAASTTGVHLRTESTTALGNTTTYETIWQLLRDVVTAWSENQIKTKGENRNDQENMELINPVLCYEYRRSNKIIKSNLLDPHRDPINSAKAFQQSKVCETKQ